MKNVCIKIQLILFSFFILLMGCSLSKPQPDILIQENKQEKKIDVVVDGTCLLLTGIQLILKSHFYFLFIRLMDLL